MLALVERWRRFWFEPESTTTLGLVRIAFGVLTIGWAVSLLPDLDDLFGSKGVQTGTPSIPYFWGLLNVWDSDTAVIVVWCALVIGAVALTVGWHSRVAALVVFVCIVAFDRRNIFVTNAGDTIMRIEALFLMLAPSGAALSLDRRRTAGPGAGAQLRAPWALRLMQVQLSLILLFSVHDKLIGATWNEGTAVSFVFQQDSATNFALPNWFLTSPLAMNVVSWGVLVLELVIAIWIWNRRLRPWLLTIGVVLQALIFLTLTVGFASFAMFVLFLAFVPPESAEGWLRRRSEGSGRSKRIFSRHRSTPDAAAEVDKPSPDAVEREPSRKVAAGTAISE